MQPLTLAKLQTYVPEHQSEVDDGEAFDHGYVASLLDNEEPTASMLIAVQAGHLSVGSHFHQPVSRDSRLSLQTTPSLSRVLEY